jgi:hypothetical protein
MGRATLPSAGSSAKHPKFSISTNTWAELLDKGLISVATELIPLPICLVSASNDC